ncbi:MULTISPECIES: helix-turn-helix transcriptional regulator [Actinosynnema]|uniref:helix-turn-helix domain-containing protein n=1 Tax=Actinosynnema TaxID=40566 RepID=UPI0020A53EA4|nr:helix-turn-helix transcriptional regulator [Actinosynnema pretiosum]MCP2093546.1 Helix-turn-helix domain-containing protein [Actinosynnema pretiosum]
MSSGPTPTDQRARLADRLRELARERGVQRADVQRVLGCSESKVGKILRGDVSVVPLELAALLDLFGVEGEARADLERLGEESRRRRPKTPWGTAVPDRLRKFFNTEETARRIESYRPDLLHGLVQTEDYARAVISTNRSLRPDEVERLVQARMARQARLTGTSPPELVLVVREAVLEAPVGTAAVRRGQLAHLKRLVDGGRAVLRVVPGSAGLTGALFFPFTVLTPPGGRARNVYVETLTDGLLVDEENRVAHYSAVFQELLDVALSPAGSAGLLDRV